MKYGTGSFREGFLKIISLFFLYYAAFCTGRRSEFPTCKSRSPNQPPPTCEFSSIDLAEQTKNGQKYLHFFIRFSVFTKLLLGSNKTREGFLRKNIVAVSFFQNCAIHPYS